MRLECREDLGARQRAALQWIADNAEAEVRGVLPSLARDLVLSVATADFVIPETGDFGASVAPGVIAWAADPSRPGGIVGVAERQLRWTLFHELHHQVRG